MKLRMRQNHIFYALNIYDISLTFALCNDACTIRARYTAYSLIKIFSSVLLDVCSSFNWPSGSSVAFKLSRRRIGSTGCKMGSSLYIGGCGSFTKQTIVLETSRHFDWANFVRRAELSFFLALYIINAHPSLFRATISRTEAIQSIPSNVYQRSRIRAWLHYAQLWILNQSFNDIDRTPRTLRGIILGDRQNCISWDT